MLFLSHVAIYVLFIVLAGAVGCGRDAMPVSVSWHTLESYERLPPSFSCSAQIDGDTADSETLRLRVTGATCIVETHIGSTGTQVFLVTGRDQKEVIAESAEALTAGTAAVVFEPGVVSIYQDGRRHLLAPVPLQQWANAGWAQSATGEPSTPIAGEFALQKLGKVFFDDDFMHVENDLGEWTPVTGDWEVQALKNPTRSANPFSLVSTSENAVITAGHHFWRNYEVACSVNTDGTAPLGLRFCQTDAYHYRLDLRPADKASVLVLSRNFQGTDTELARAPLAGIAGQWTRLRAAQFHGRITVWRDGMKLMEVDDPDPLRGGALGLTAEKPATVRFDDVTARPVSQINISMAESAAFPLLAPVPDGWMLAGLPLTNAVVTVTITSTSEKITLTSRWNAAGDYVSATFEPGSDGQATVNVSEVTSKKTVAAARSLPMPAPPFTFSLYTQNDDVWGTINGKIVATHKCRNIVQPGMVRVFGDIAGLVVAPVTALPTIASRVRTFTHEKSMESWSQPDSDWVKDSAAAASGLHWHRNDFWQDVSVEVDLRPQGGKLENPIALFLAPEADAPVDDCVELLVEPGGAVTFRTDTKTAALLDKLPSFIRLERRGGKVLAWVDGDLRWQAELPAHLDELCRVGIRTVGEAKEWADTVTIGAAGMRTYSFSTAPVDWLPVAGAWKVTNRWQCDPRWSFYSGFNRPGVACNWHKARHGKNMTIDFFAGPKMQKERGGDYEYAADINAVIAGDGIDVNSGYSFMFGGKENSGSMIARGDAYLHENKELPIDRKEIHRRWFHIKIRKYGNTLSYWIEGKLAGEVTDDKLLAGDRFGLWTWDNGMMISQLRIANDRPFELAPTVNSSSAPKTPYDAHLSDPHAGDTGQL
jgi:hypothetical protein